MVLQNTIVGFVLVVMLDLELDSISFSSLFVTNLIWVGEKAIMVSAITSISLSGLLPISFIFFTITPS